MERQFLRPVYLGESVVPFRLLTPPLGVIPWDSKLEGLLDAGSAGLVGFPHLATWLKQAERNWEEHRSSERLSFRGRIDYHRELSAQFPPPPLRVVYSTSGTLLVAALVTDREAVIDTSLYWAPVDTESEAGYLIAILTSETTRRRFESLQAWPVGSAAFP